VEEYGTSSTAKTADTSQKARFYSAREISPKYHDRAAPSDTTEIHVKISSKIHHSKL